MERSESGARSWSSAKLFGLVVLCLLSAAGIGYLARSSFQTTAAKPQVAVSSVPHAPYVKITPDQLKQQADKQAEPLLARLRKSPDDPFLLAEIGRIYFQMRQFSMAARYYEDSVRARPDAVVLVKLGGAYHFDRDDSKAISAWNSALRLDPNNPDALFNIGFVRWHAQGDREAAIAAWQKLLKTNPSHPKRAQVEALLEQAKQHSDAPVDRNK